MYTITQIVRGRAVYVTPDNGTSYVARIDYTMKHSFPKLYYVLTLLTIRLLKATKTHRRMQAEMKRQHSQPDSSMTFALVIVVIVFIICRAPHFILLVLSLLGRLSSVVMCYMDLIYSTLLAFNSPVNFLIYIVIDIRFQNVLFANVCRRRSAIRVVTANTMAMPERER